MSARAKLGVAIATVFALGLGALFGKLDREEPTAAPPPTPRATIPSAGVLPSPTSSPPVRTQDPAPPQPTHPDQVEVTARARAVEMAAVVGDLQRIELSGAIDMRVLIAHEVVDGRGRNHGSGTLRVRGSKVIVSGGSLELSSGRIRIRPDETTIEGHWSNAVRSEGAMRLRGARFTFGSFGDEKSIPGPVRLGQRSELELGDPEDDARQLRWVRAPASMAVTGVGRATLSWAGDGTMRGSRGTVRARYGGFEATDIEVQVRRRPRHVTVDGIVTATQLYREGRPVWRTKGTARLKITPEPVRRGEAGIFSWAPTNLGSADMCVTRIRAASTAGRWVYLALSPLPAMFGGQPHRPIGGDTSTLRYSSGGFLTPPTAPINSVIQVGTGDERSITFAVPRSAARGTHTIVLVLEGNFEPITFRVRVRVR